MSLVGFMVIVRTWLERMRRAFHDRRDQVIDKKAGGPCEPPAW